MIRRPSGACASPRPGRGCDRNAHRDVSEIMPHWFTPPHESLCSSWPLDSIPSFLLAVIPITSDQSPLRVWRPFTIAHTSSNAIAPTTDSRLKSSRPPRPVRFPPMKQEHPQGRSEIQLPPPIKRLDYHEVGADLEDAATDESQSGGSMGECCGG